MLILCKKCAEICFKILFQLIQHLFFNRFSAQSAQTLHKFSTISGLHTKISVYSCWPLDPGCAYWHQKHCRNDIRKWNLENVLEIKHIARQVLMYNSNNFHWLHKKSDLERTTSELGKPFPKKSDRKNLNKIGKSMAKCRGLSHYRPPIMVYLQLWGGL